MPVDPMYMWYVFSVCDDRDMSLKTSLTHIALTTAFVDATACAEHRGRQNRKINHPRARLMDTSRIEGTATPRNAEIRAGMMFFTTPMVFM